MSKELVISANRHETKVAILEEDQLVEVYFQRANEYSLAGSIHKGKVTRVLPGMQSAFVDLGLERDTFLYVSDFLEENEDFDRVLPAREEKQFREDRPPREDRGPREDRQPRLERVERPAPVEMMPEPPSLEAEPEGDELEEIPEAGIPADSAAEPVPVSADSALSAAPERTERREEGDDRERRGRRSRRRRNRGRGFPDSKYASDAPSPQLGSRLPEPPPSAPEEITAPPVDTGDDYEFPVLPGESLAKYRHPVRPNGAPQHQEVSAELVESTSGPAQLEPWSEPVEFSSAGAAVAREPEAVPEEPEIAPIAESVASSAHADASAEAEAIAGIIAIERESGAFTAEELAESPVPSVELIEAEGLDLEDEPELAEVEAGEGQSPGDETADDGTSEEETPEGIGIAQAPANLESRPQQPQVREPGGRFGQRGPRRMRRRPRGGGSGPSPEAVPTISRTDAPPQRSGPRYERNQSNDRPERPERGERTDKSPMPSITDLLKEGQEILVQIAKEPLGQKGARITSHIALPGRYVVFMPTLEHMGVSRKIASDEERLRLKKILQAHRANVQGGFIVRTAGEGKSEEEILADMTFLGNLWQDIRQKAEKKPAPLLLHHDLDIVQRILRDQVTDHFKSIWVDSEEAYESILRFVQRFQPALVSRVKLYTRTAPIFDAFNITQELEKALRPKVWLKSGGYIVINQTEALVAVDVNTGKYVGKSNRLEDTIVKTNTEAVKEIVRQIRLRDLGGIIVVDFIDMDERKNRQKVMQALEEAMRADKAPNKILQFNDFGLVAITRKRVKQSLERALCSPCPYCEGAGYVKSVQTTVAEIVQEATKIARAVEGKDVLLRVHPEVAKFLKSSQNKYLEELEEVLRKPVMVKGDPTLHQDKFDLA